jgi:hypothetical protein
MSAVDLNFTGAFQVAPASSVRLNFGLNVSVVVDPRVVRFAAVRAAPVLSARAVYSTNVVRLVTSEQDFSWSKAAPESKSAEQLWQQSANRRVSSIQPWGEARTLTASVSASVEQLRQKRSSVKEGWELAKPLPTPGLKIGVKALATSKLNSSVPWSLTKPLNATADSRFKQLTPFKRGKCVGWSYGHQAVVTRSFNFGRAFGKPVTKDLLWQLGRRPPPGRAADPPVVTPPKPDYVGATLLKFQCKYTGVNPRGVNLNFGLHPCPDTGLLIPIRKVYFIVNEVSLKRISDNVPIHFTSVSTGTDDDSWCWSFTASVPYSELEKIEPTASGPVEVELAINSQVWRFAIEGYTDDEEFAKTNITVKGRSLTAYLEDPYAPTRSFKQATALNSRQFAEAELTRPGLVTGYSLDWQLIDSLGWLMPADTWSYSELTPIQVIQNIVQGAGGYVNSHPADKQLLVKAKYPTPYWEWSAATGLLTIPRSFVKRQSLEWHEKPAYNGVYVSGENTGVTAFVKRTGTAGEFQAPMFVNPMISAAAAARNKGMSILSAGGKQATVSLDLPMEASLGLVSPGVMVEVTNGGLGTAPAWRGIVRSSSVAANWGRGLTVNQSLRVERHYGS